MSDDLLTFLRARYDDDARLIDEYDAFHRGLPVAAIVVPPGWLLGEPFDIGRQRAEVDATRDILDAILKYEAAIDGEWGDGHTAEQIAAGECPERHPDDIPAFRAMALPFAGHPDYRSEWAVAK